MSTAAVEDDGLTWREVPPLIITILAWTGALLSCLLTIPQAVRTLRCHRLDGLSATTYWIVVGNAAVWASWSVLTGEYAAGVPALVNGPAALLILLRLHRSHRSVARVISVQPDDHELPLSPPPALSRAALPVGACP